MTEQDCLDHHSRWLTLVVPRACRLVDAALEAMPPDEDGQPEEEELKDVGRRLHWQRTEDGWYAARDRLTAYGVPFIGGEGPDEHWPELMLASVDGVQHYAAAVAGEAVVAIDLDTGAPQTGVLAGMKEFIECRKKAIEAIRGYVPGSQEVGETASEGR